MRFKPLFLAMALAAGAATQGVSAAPCVGFNDVQDTDSFCGAVEWLKNRAITLGCAATSYCPFDNVTRAQMALFMQRLGSALTDSVLSQTEASAVRDIDSNPVICQTSDYPVVGFPRQARLDGIVNVRGAAAELAYMARIMYSLNAGATWLSTAMISGGIQAVQHLPANVTGHRDVITLVDHHQAMNVGSTYRFGIQLARYAGTDDPTAWCTIRVYVMNRNPGTSPLDE